MKNIPFIITSQSITAVINGHPYSASSSNANFNQIKERLSNEDFDGLEDLFNTGSAVTSFTNGNITVTGNSVLYKGANVDNYVVDRILEFMKQGLPYKPLLNFLDKLMANPSYRAVTELYGFLESAKLPICEDGDFLAYRKVTEDYKDFYTKSFDNSVGKTVEVPRNQVDEDKNRTCSRGLHFCAQSYLGAYHGGAGKVVIVKISPADVCAIPADYANAKGRCCKYTVYSDCVGGEDGQTFGPLHQSPEGNDACDDCDCDCDADEIAEESFSIGAERGAGDASYGLTCSPDTSLNEFFDEECWDESDINRDSFVDGYRKAYVDYKRVQVAAQSPMPKRDSNGRFCK